MLTVAGNPFYLFIRLGQGDSAPSWAAIRSTKGISRLVGFGVGLAEVADSLAKVLRAQEASVQAEPERLFNPGGVCLTEAPFFGIGSICQVADEERCVMVLIELLSKQVRVRLAQANLRKAG